jgi:hypothetical protein
MNAPNDLFYAANDDVRKLLPPALLRAEASLRETASSAADGATAIATQPAAFFFAPSEAIWRVPSGCLTDPKAVCRKDWGRRLGNDRAALWPWSNAGSAGRVK